MKESDTPHILFVAGETSGDGHGAELIRALKALNPDLRCSGIGGARMAAEGMEIDEDLTPIAVVGFVEVLKHYGHFKKAFNAVIRKCRKTRIDAAVLIDYPGFNLRLARKLHKLGIKVFYFISPQVWAWKKNRVHHIRRDVDKMLVLFPFEEELYKEAGVDAVCVGHPLTDTAKPAKTREEIRKILDLNPDSKTIGLLPGSRSKEIERHLPLMLQAFEKMSSRFMRLQAVVLKAPSIPADVYEKHIRRCRLPAALSEESLYDTLNACDAACVASGTATLEAGLIGTPMVVIYKTSFLTWQIAKRIVTLPFISLVNIISGKQIVTELIQKDANSDRISEELTTLLSDEKKILAMKEDLGNLRESLGDGGACEKAATIILDGVTG